MDVTGVDERYERNERYERYGRDGRDGRAGRMAGSRGSLRSGPVSWSDPGDPARAGGSPSPEPSRESPEDRLARLGAAVGPLRRVMAAVAARLVETKAYRRLCYGRLADYARERPGLSVRQLQELARVHRALAELPLLERALVSNALPWSKVRAVARVAWPEDEAAWVGRARALPVRRLEAEVCAALRRQRELMGERLEEPDTAEPQRQVRVRCTPAVREAWAAAHELAERVAGRRICTAQALELAVAEALSEVPIDPALSHLLDPEPPRRARAGGDGESGPRSPLPRAPARPAPDWVTALARGLDAADASELDRRLRVAVKLEQTLDAAMAPLLRAVSSPEYEWNGKEPQPLASYAPEQLAMSASKARALLRLERAGRVCPELHEAWRAGRISWVKAQCLLPLLLLDIDDDPGEWPGHWRAAWVAWAERVTVRRLEADVERALLLRAGHDRAWARCKHHPERAGDALPDDEQQMCAPEVDLEATQELVFRLPAEVASLYGALRETLRRRMRVVGPGGTSRGPTDGEVLEAVLELAVAAWQARDPRARRPDPVIERDGYRCAVPGCTSREGLHDHHVVFRSAGGSDAPDNRITLCVFHHQYCVHAGLMRVSGQAPDALLFELGLRPDGPPLARYRSGDVEIPVEGAMV